MVYHGDLGLVYSLSLSVINPLNQWHHGTHTYFAEESVHLSSGEEAAPNIHSFSLSLEISAYANQKLDPTGSLHTHTYEFPIFPGCPSLLGIIITSI